MQSILEGKHWYMNIFLDADLQRGFLIGTKDNERKNSRKTVRFEKVELT